jgi:hypothetical protein
MATTHGYEQAKKRRRKKTSVIHQKSQVELTNKSKKRDPQEATKEDFEKRESKKNITLKASKET